jgi:hypothetical protein
MLFSGCRQRSASTPEEAWELALAALQAEDVDAYLAQTRGGLHAQLDLGRAVDEMLDAMKEKFGEGALGKEKTGVITISARQGIRKWKEQRFEIKSKRVRNDSLVELTVWEFHKEDDKEIVTEVPWFAVKEGGGWKLDRENYMKVIPRKDGNIPHRRLEGELPADLNKDRPHREAVEGAKVLRKLAADIRAGKYASTEAVVVEVNRLLREVRMRIEEELDG